MYIALLFLGLISLSGVEPTPLSREYLSLRDTTCPDGGKCKDNQTCCKLATGGYGCCPYPNAMCCSDGKHCCPNGYTCDSGGTCTRKGDDPPFYMQPLGLRDTPCPDGKSECKDSQTCCMIAKGGYGCCPYTNAKCCSDGKHCCPSGYTCDVSGGTCTRAAITWW